MRAIGIVLVTVVLSAPVACTRDRDRAVGETTVTGATVGAIGNADAIDRLVEARCARVAVCERPKRESAEASPEACKRDLRRGLAVELDPATSCPRGIDANKLDDCVASIASAECASGVEPMASLIACRASELCPRIAHFPTGLP